MEKAKVVDMNSSKYDTNEGVYRVIDEAWDEEAGLGLVNTIEHEGREDSNEHREEEVTEGEIIINVEKINNLFLSKCDSNKIERIPYLPCLCLLLIRCLASPVDERVDLVPHRPDRAHQVQPTEYQTRRPHSTAAAVLDDRHFEI